jgi:hypothetical protein
MSRHDMFDNAEVLSIIDIVVRDAWQVRKGITKTFVKRYAANYSSGVAMEPIKVARVGDALILTDGAHRIAALQSIGAVTVEAIVTPMKEFEAQWAAARANLAHGKPLAECELRAVFRQYIATGQHRKGRSKFKSLAEIATDIPGRTRYAYRRWLVKDYPELYSKHYAGSGAEAHSHGGIQTVRPTQQATDLATIADLLKQVQALALTFPSGAMRRRIAKQVEDAGLGIAL